MSRYFEHIEDCTVYAWNKALKGDYTHLRIEGGTHEEDLKAWDKVYNSYIVELGLGNNYNNLIELENRLSGTQLDYIISNDRMLLNKIDMLESEISDVISRTNPNQDITTMMLIISKWSGFKNSQKNTTVLEFHKTLNLMKEENGKNK